MRLPRAGVRQRRRIKGLNVPHRTGRTPCCPACAQRRAGSTRTPSSLRLGTLRHKLVCPGSPKAASL